MIGQQMASPEAHAAALVVERLEKGHAHDVVEMGMGKEDVDVARALGLELLAQRAKPGAGVEDEDVGIAAHLQAGGVAAIALIGRSSTGNAATNAPECNGKAAGHLSS